MEKVRPWCGQPSDQGRLRNRTEQIRILPITSAKKICKTIRILQFTCLKIRRSANPHFTVLQEASETCCPRLAENTGWKKVAKNPHLGTIAQLSRAISSQLRHVSTIGKKLIKQQICPPHVPTPHNMVNFRPIVAEIDPVV